MSTHFLHCKVILLLCCTNQTYFSQVINISPDVSYLRQEIRKAQISLDQELEAKAILKIDSSDMTLQKAEQLLMSRLEARNYTEALESVKILR